MKVKLFTLLCFVSPFLVKGGPLSGQLYSIRDQFYALPQNLTIENIRSVLDQIEGLVQSKDDVTHEEDIAIMGLNTYGGFLDSLEKYMKNPTDKGFASELKQWAECKPDCYDFLQQAIEKNPENEALKSIDLNFYTWWKYDVPCVQW